MKLGILIGITRDGQKPVVIGEAGPLTEARAALRRHRVSGDGDRFERVQVWTNRQIVAECKLKPTPKPPKEERKAKPKKKVSKAATTDE